MRRSRAHDPVSPYRAGNRPSSSTDQRLIQVPRNSAKPCAAGDSALVAGAYRQTLRIDSGSTTRLMIKPKGLASTLT